MAIICTIAAPIGTPNASWTEVVDASQSTPTTGYYVQTRDSGFTGTSLTFGNSAVGANGSLLIELDASAPSGLPYLVMAPRIGV
jgi:hypothetical protein